jgi:prepilin-type N-terminal cleavage/methylation domain-containing protein
VNKRRQQVAFPASGTARNGERGLTLIEVLVALGILAAVAVVFLLGMSTSSKAVMVSQEAVAVDSLAKSQMEYVKSQPYDADHNPPQYLKLADEDIPDGYDIIITPARLDPDYDGFMDDDGLQEITVNVTRNGETAFELVGYKVKP